MNNSKYLRRALVVLAVVLALLAVARAGLAGAAGETVAPQPLPPVPGSYRLFMSTPGSGTIGNISYADEDILSYKPATGQWVKTFDGTNAGLPAAADIDAFAYAYDSQNLASLLYMSFDAPVSVPGLGKVDDSDVVLYRVTFGGAMWQMVFDGSQYGLTTAAEDVDAFELAADGEYLISTAGNFSVPGHYGATLTGGDEDIIRYVQGAFTPTLDGTNMGLAAANDVTGLAYEYGGEGQRFYLVTGRAYNFQGASGGAGSVLLYVDGTYGLDTYANWWQPVSVGKIDAFDLKLE